MDTSSAWEQSWLSGPNGPVLIPGTHLDKSIQYRLERALHEAAALWDQQCSALRDTTPEVIYEAPEEPSGWHRYYANLRHKLPLHEWAVERANIHSRLLTMRNSLFREILRRSSGSTEKRIKKKVGYLDWPNAITADDWIDKRKNLSFVPEVILDRIEVTQPFRDKYPDGSPPSEDWVRQGGVQSSRREANEDKHERTATLAVNLTCPRGVIANYSFSIIDQDQREAYSSPFDGQPIFSVKADLDCSNLVLVKEVTVHLVVPNSGIGSKDAYPWTLASEGLWHQLLESLWVFHVILLGREAANEASDPLVEKFTSFWASGDTKYQLSDRESWRVIQRPNPFRELAEFTREAHERIAALERR